MRLLSSEAKDWKSRVVTEAEEVLCRESAQTAQQATKAQEAMDQHYKARWQQAEADLKALCQSNSAQAQSLASKLHETNEYVHPAPCCIPPDQWGYVQARERGDGCELFVDMPSGDDPDLPSSPSQNARQQDELENARLLQSVHAQSQPISGARCVNGNPVRPDNSEEEPPSTACRQSAVHASGGVALGRVPPGFGKSPGSVPGRHIPPPPPPPPPAPGPHGPAASSAANYP